MNILASSPPPPPTTHIHIHIWWSVVFSQLISGQINQRPYLQSICWEGAVGSRRHSNMLDNNRKWKDSTQTLPASHFTVHYVLSIQMSGQDQFCFPGTEHKELFWICLLQLVTSLDLFIFLPVNTVKLCNLLWGVQYSLMFLFHTSGYRNPQTSSLLIVYVESEIM